MFRITLYITLIVFLNSCSPIIKIHGYSIENTTNFEEVFLETELSNNDILTKDDIAKHFGSPSVSITDIDNIWIYIISELEEKVFDEDVLSFQFILKFKFDINDNLIEKTILSQEDYNKIVFSKDKTITPKSNYSLVDQIADAFTRGNWLKRR